MIRWEKLYAYEGLDLTTIERVDGRLVQSGGPSVALVGVLTDDRIERGLDIACSADTCCVTEDEIERAREAWADGRVFLSTDIDQHGADTLVVPVGSLTPEVVTEALRRFLP